MRAALALGEGETEVIRLRRLRLIAGKPVLYEQTWLPYHRFAPILETSPAEIGDLLYPAYEKFCGEVIARAEETLTVGRATAEDAVLLGLAEGAPVVVIERLAFGYDGRPMEWRHSRGPTTEFRYKVDIR